MRIFYKIHLSGEHDEADVLSIGLAAENGVSAYAEINDYERGKIDEATDEHIISEFLGNKGMEDLIVSRKKTKGLIAPAWRVNEFINSFFSPYDTIELIGFSNYYEQAAMAKFLDLEQFSKHTNLVNYSYEFVEKYSDLFDNVLEDFPDSNALRWAVFYKHIAKKYERKKALKN